jgi:plasmid stabilization system protein ParE
VTRIVIRPAAAADIDEAFLWYERRRPGLGDEFLAALQAALEGIAAQPTLHAVIHRDTRRALLIRFPYGVCSGRPEHDDHLLVENRFWRKSLLAFGV